MTVDEKLDLILTKLGNVESDVKTLKNDVKDLKKMDGLILDEVERVHTLLNKHINNKTVHIA